MLPNMLKYRMEKHVTAPFYAAHGLDPLYFQKGSDGCSWFPARLTTHEWNIAEECLIGMVEPNEADDLKTEIG
eukprot:16152-Chlamydomonas_euryale.AAC.1